MCACVCVVPNYGVENSGKSRLHNYFTDLALRHDLNVEENKIVKIFHSTLSGKNLQIIFIASLLTFDIAINMNVEIFSNYFNYTKNIFEAKAILQLGQLSIQPVLVQFDFTF